MSGVASRPSDVMAYVNCTLLSVAMEDRNGEKSISSLMEHCTSFLKDNELVSLQTVVDDGRV